MTASWLPPDLDPEPSSDAPETVATVQQPAAATEPGQAGASDAPVPQPTPPQPVAGPKLASAAEISTSAIRPGDSPSAYGRRTRAVEAYCRELFAPADVAMVAQEILGSLSGGISEDAVLLRETRTSAAVRLSRATGPGGQGLTEHCAATAGRLAARANGALKGREHAQLQRHLASCLACRGAELRARRADRAFAAILGLRPD